MFAIIPWWLKLIAVAVIAGLLLWGWHVFTESYREEGRAEVQSQWDLAKAAALKANTEQEQRWQKESAAREKAEKELEDERTKRAALAADAAKRLPDRVARVVVPRESVRVLNSAIDAGNPAPATGTARESAKATPAAAEGADSNVGLLTQWGVACISAYDEARGMVKGWQDFYAGLRAAQ